MLGFLYLHGWLIIHTISHGMAILFQGISKRLAADAVVALVEYTEFGEPKGKVAGQLLVKE